MLVSVPYINKKDGETDLYTSHTTFTKEDNEVTDLEYKDNVISVIPSGQIDCQQPSFDAGFQEVCPVYSCITEIEKVSSFLNHQYIGYLRKIKFISY